MRISDEIKDNIIATAKLEEIISDFITLKKEGKDLLGTCPYCQKTGKGKGIRVSPGKNIYKCFSCGEGGNSSVTFLMETQRMDYPTALKYIADKYSIDINGPRVKPKKKFESFRDAQLKSSGLKDADQKAFIKIDNDTTEEVDVFVPGSINEYGDIDPSGDDMIMRYVNLDGKFLMYKKPNSTKYIQFYRIRYHNPAQHLDKHGVPIKYQSPYKSGSHLYIPQIIRSIYQEGRQIETLYLQEGEKKAEKASKHGMPSVGIMGIHNIGQNGKLPYELQQIVQRCGVKKVVFVMDADWNELSTTLRADRRIDIRPYTFFCAVKNFRDYFRTFTNLNIYLELFFAHGIEPEAKGIDDLLCTEELKANPEKLKADFDRALNEKDGCGDYVRAYKVSTMPDLKLMELWKLQSVTDFYNHHKEKISASGLKEFLYAKHRWKFNEETNKLELAQPLEDDEQFWVDESYFDKRTDQRKEQYQYDYVNAMNFLRNRGFGRIRMASGQYQFCRIENKVVRIVDSYEIKDFVLELSRQICNKGIRNMLLRGGKMYLGPDQLGNLEFFNPEFEICGRDFQYFFFGEMFWKIDADKIIESNMINLEKNIWHDKVRNFPAKYLQQPLLTVTPLTAEFLADKSETVREKLSHFIGKYDISFSEDGQKCHFLRFLDNTSNFYKNFKHEPNTPDDQRQHIEIEQRFETNAHLLAKLTALGYLLHKYRNKSCEKAVIAMDGKLSEVGESNGRSGKSLFGVCIKHLIPQVVVNGKNKNLTEDPFWAEEVTEKTDNIFIDDVRTNFDFEFLFNAITGNLTVNKKGQTKFTLSDDQTPKILISTNHSINGDSGSYRARQMLVAFSDYYNENHRPEHDFDKNFFREWDFLQWNLFYNLAANALQLYFKFGLIESPTERLERRRLRQFIGEDFMTWAHEYFGTLDDQPVDEIYNAAVVNHKRSRKELFDDFITKNPNARKWITANKFKRKIICFCEYMGLAFNPHSLDKEGMPGGDDKSGGVEYFNICNNKY